MRGSERNITVRDGEICRREAERINYYINIRHAEIVAHPLTWIVMESRVVHEVFNSAMLPRVCLRMSALIWAYFVVSAFE